jgi:hypothetical protein
MTLKKLVLRLFILILLSSFVIIGSVTFFIYHRANKSSQLLENQLLETAYDIYASELSGSIIINNPKVIQALIDDLAGTRNLRAKLVSNSRMEIWILGFLVYLF